MTLLIGTDEAGYGPNLGPLVISATVWRIPDDASPGDLRRRLADVIVSSPRQAAGKTSSRVAIADSKALYKPRQTLRHLERGLFAALGAMERRPTTWRETFDTLDPKSRDSMEALPWYVGYDATVPLDAARDEVQRAASALSEGLRARDVQLVDIRSRAIFPDEFNRSVELHDSKGTVLSHATLALASHLSATAGDEPIVILCDKHGGRSRYADLIGRHWPDQFIEIHGEGRRESVYRFGPRSRRLEIRFRVKAEDMIPPALASMASKYLRELAMQAFNAFWVARIPQLRPTAGYPQDAKRFQAEIAAVQAELGIDNRVVWRNR